jgi:hypothetical protein
MTPAEIEAAMLAAFNQCEQALCPLTEKQKQILLQVVVEELSLNQVGNEATSNDADTNNPLDELTPEQRQTLLQFIKEQERQHRSWKIILLNDWLHDRNSGAVQFIRDRYGSQWLNRIKPIHIAAYFEQETDETLKIKVGSRIEVSNRLWEWVQESDPDSQEWFSCTVIGVYQAYGSDRSHTNCIIRFQNGTEYEIQGIYEWNRYNWRWSLE